MAFEMGSWCPYSCSYVGCCHQDLFNTAHSILVQLLSSFFSIHLISIYVVHPFSSINTNRCLEETAFYFISNFGKGKKQAIPSTNHYRRRLCWWHSASNKYTCLGQILLHSLEQATYIHRFSLFIDLASYNTGQQKFC